MHPVTGGSPRPPGLPALRAAAADCKACDLWKRGTQTVFGEGTRNAGIVLVGEQPGDKEDVAESPSSGPRVSSSTGRGVCPTTMRAAGHTRTWSPTSRSPRGSSEAA
jgi:hypothetical protein